MNGYIITKNTKNLFTNHFVDFLILIIVSMFIYLCHTKPILFNPMEYVCSHLHKARSHLTELKEKHILHDLRTDVDLCAVLKYQKEFKKQFLFIENCIFQTENALIHYPLSSSLNNRVPDIEKSGLVENHIIYKSIFNNFIAIMEEHIENYPKQFIQIENFDDNWAVISLKNDCNKYRFDSIFELLFKNNGLNDTTYLLRQKDAQLARILLEEFKIRFCIAGGFNFYCFDARTKIWYYSKYFVNKRQDRINEMKIKYSHYSKTINTINKSFEELLETYDEYIWSL